MSTEQDIPYGFCHCGCGQKTSIAKTTRRLYGHVKGQPVRFKVGHAGAKPLAQKLAARTGPEDENGCWPWRGDFGNSRYGVMAHRGKARTAHRWAWINTHGPIPDGHQIHHKCGNPSCVNPEHLEAVSVSEHAERHLTESCERGHEWTKENTYVNKDGNRFCRACRALYQRRWRGKRPRRECGACGEEFVTTPEFRRYCSVECQAAGYGRLPDGAKRGGVS